MSNYYELILDALNEKEKTIKDLETKGILGKNTFYIFKSSAPSLITMIKISNFLNMTIDYILDRTNENKFMQQKLTRFLGATLIITEKNIFYKKKRIIFL